MGKNAYTHASEKVVIGKKPENPIICWTLVGLLGVLLYLGPKQIIPNSYQWNRPGASWIIGIFYVSFILTIASVPFYWYYEVSGAGLTEFRLGRKAALRTIPWSEIRPDGLYHYGGWLVVATSAAPAFKKGNPIVYYYKNRKTVLCIYDGKKALDAFQEFCPDDTLKERLAGDGNTV